MRDDPDPDPEPAGTAPEPTTSLADVDSLDGIINALYAAVSFTDGQVPAWARFRGLFLAGATLARIPVCGTGEHAKLALRSVEGHITRSQGAIADGALSAFTERELTRRTEVFADLAQVFSTFERSEGGGNLQRGVNALQLVKASGRWWIVSLSWTDERPEAEIPSRYLPRV